MSFWKSTREALAHLCIVFPPTADGKAHLHTEVLDLIEEFGLEQVVTPAAIRKLADKHSGRNTPIYQRPPEEKPKFGVIEGGRNG